MSGLVSLVVGVATSQLISYFESNRTKLQFSVISKSSFVGKSKTVGVFAIEIKNKGDKDLEDVQATLKWPDQTIITDATLTARGEASPLTIKPDKPNVEAKIARLNPNESDEIAVLLDFTKGNPLAEPNIFAEAKDVTGVKVDRSDSRLQTIWLPAISGFMGILCFVVLRFFTGSPVGRDTRDVMSFLLGLEGLTDKAREIVSLPRQVSYCALSDYVTQTAQNDVEKIRKHINCMKNLMSYAALDGMSKSIIQYNLARLHAKSGNVKDAKELLKLAYAAQRKLIRRRIEMTLELKGMEPW
jgi:hypothetical protein